MKKFLVIICLGITLCNMCFAQAPPYPTVPAPLVEIVKAEYFFDTDPGFGNGTDLPITDAININNLNATLTLSGSALTSGLHKLYIRTQDANGAWSHTATAQFSKFDVPIYPSAPASLPAITGAEYFIDTDPGLGMGTAITVPSSPNISDLSVLVNVSALTQGTHRLYIRTRNANGVWSLTNYAVFNTALPLYPTAPAPAPNLANAEYFIDNDPGFGNGTPITVPPATTDLSDFSVSVPIGTLSEGPHTIYIRSQQNPWSMSAYAAFTKGTILPLTWLYVKGEARQGNTHLTWATGQEDNTSHYEIEYSTDGSKYTVAGRVQAAGQSSTSRSYAYVHTITTNGIYYYRIKQVDKDGKFTYSKVLTLRHGAEPKETYIMPNPVGDIMHIVEPGEIAVKRVEVFDMSGKSILNEQFNGSQRVLSVKTNRLVPGSYIVKVYYLNSQKTFTILKK